MELIEYISCSLFAKQATVQHLNCHVGLGRFLEVDLTDSIRVFVVQENLYQSGALQRSEIDIKTL